MTFSSLHKLVGLAGFIAALPSVSAGFDAGSTKNVAVYWGQNSANSATSQQRLSYYCNSTAINIIPLSFMDGITPPVINFASATDHCTPINGTGLYTCPQIEADIQTCQKQGKTILLSVGGATYNQGGWGSAQAAQAAAQSVWKMFGPLNDTTVPRPFGKAVIDGFDFDFEAPTSNLPAFGAELRRLMDAAGGKKYYLSAAPQCVYPDAADGATLDAVPFDFVNIQFYNNWCGVNSFKAAGSAGADTTSAQNAFNFETWDKWAAGSKNPNVKLLLGIPAAAGAGGGYVRGAQLDDAIKYSKNFTHFGGVMLWDMSQLFENTGFLEEVAASL
ncbi:Chitinase 3 [Escovopsis weberi]|uniref:chitinase n=1 Tax=Escovopsis weberi TaxID=150374 RepID=A0A0M9VXA9_ESCWE|nr:Chitinase 3 [Escovopsis weberi]